jgi:voltage-gated potassium channel
MPERPGLMKRYRHAQLLFALALLLLAEPFVESVAGSLFFDVFLAITVVSVVVACSTRRRNLVIGLTLAVLMQVSLVYRTIHEMKAIDTTHSLFAIALFGYVTALVLSDVFRRGDSVSTDTICGALAGYLLLGLTWTFAFTLLESLQPGSFVGLAPTGDAMLPGYKRFLGYSFVTLTTLGYGNVVPSNPRADALATWEAIVGQVYLTVLVARLVALNLKNGSRPADHTNASQDPQNTT